MKKISALLLVLTLIASCFCFTSCGNKGKTLEQVKAAGKLVIATSPDFPPFESLGKDNKVEGIEIEIMEAVCKKLGVTLQIETMDFDSVLVGVQTGKYDVGVSGISVTPAREKNTLFTTPYCLAAQAIVVKTDSTIQGKADLAGKKISVQSGTTAEEYCRDKNYDVSSFQNNSDAASALTSGRVDAWVIDDLTAAEMVSQLEGVKILDEAMTTEPYAFAMAMGSETLRDEIDKIIKELLADGTIKNLFDKYNAPYTAPSEAN